MTNYAEMTASDYGNNKPCVIHTCKEKPERISVFCVDSIVFEKPVWFVSEIVGDDYCSDEIGCILFCPFCGRELNPYPWERAEA